MRLKTDSLGPLLSRENTGKLTALKKRATPQRWLEEMSFEEPV